MTSTQTFTTFCSKGNDIAGMAIQAFDAADREEAAKLGISQAAEAWGCSIHDVQCRGVYPGNITELNWD